MLLHVLPLIKGAGSLLHEGFEECLSRQTSAARQSEEWRNAINTDITTAITTNTITGNATTLTSASAQYTLPIILTYKLLSKEIRLILH